MRIAVIDLGTNTFHLLIAEKKPDGSVEHLYRERCYVRLAEEGIEHIGDDAFARGLEAISRFVDILGQYDVERWKAIGTAALRTADNGSDFVVSVRQQTGVVVELITGRDEAAFIHRGVRAAVPMSKGIDLIMDIGGGSVEFIIADSERVYWSDSYPVGVAILFNRFHKSDPICEADTLAIHRFLSKELSSWIDAIRRYPVANLIGASGAFDTIEELTVHERMDELHSVVSLPEFYRLFEYLTHTTLEERRSIEKLPGERVEMIIVAMVLLDFVIRQAGIKQITVCQYAMKEGVLSEL